MLLGAAEDHPACQESLPEASLHFGNHFPTQQAPKTLPCIIVGPKLILGLFGERRGHAHAAGDFVPGYRIEEKWCAKAQNRRVLPAGIPHSVTQLSGTPAMACTL